MQLLYVERSKNLLLEFNITPESADPAKFIGAFTFQEQCGYIKCFI